MIRRDVLRRDNRPVKWFLVAAACALSLGLYAEHAMTTAETDSQTAVVQKAAPAPAPPATAG
jgi:hypothetical protein